jgi:GrpB-like predicted nucleotidyltransferase (UPF0157 family)
MSEPIIIVPYNADWKKEFISIGSLIREALDTTAIRIDHIGSTSVQELAAKPIIDIQVSVKSLEYLNMYKPMFEQIGFIHRAGNPDRTKSYFRETPGNRRTHIHVREYRSWSEQFALLFRDYLRNHSEDCVRYSESKYELANLYRNERDKYVEAKEPIIWEIMKKASKWSQEVGWKPLSSDI